MDNNEEDEDDQKSENDTALLVGAMLSGRELTSQFAKVIEETLSSQPDNLASRITLISYYDQQGASFAGKRVEHILWIIANHPDLCRYVTPGLAVSQTSEFYDQVKAAWLEQIENHPAKVAVLMNAAMVFRCEADFAFQLLEKSAALAPDDLDVQGKLANHYRCKALISSGEEAKSNDTIALHKYENILSQRSNATERFYQLTDVATTAFGAGDLQRANEIAMEMLQVAPKFVSDWNYGNAIFWANIVLGKIALSQGDTDEACNRLIAASETTGSPQLDSFGPEFVLCSQLLSMGKQEPVKSYLLNCAKFWEMDEGCLSRWLEDINNGTTPDFSRTY